MSAENPEPGDMFYVKRAGKVLLLFEHEGKLSNLILVRAGSVGGYPRYKQGRLSGDNLINYLKDNNAKYVGHLDIFCDALESMLKL